MNVELRDWIGYGFGAFALVALSLTYQQKERTRLIICKLCADILWGAHYALLGAFAAVVSNCVGVCREVVFLHRGRKKWADSFVFPILFIVIGVILGASAFDSPIDILPILASTCATVAFWCKKPHITKLIAVPASTAFLIYDLCISPRSYPGLVCEIIGLSSIFVWFLRDRRDRRMAAVQEQKEFSPHNDCWQEASIHLYSFHCSTSQKST